MLREQEEVRRAWLLLLRKVLLEIISEGTYIKGNLVDHKKISKNCQVADFLNIWYLLPSKKVSILTENSKIFRAKSG